MIKDEPVEKDKQIVLKEFDTMHVGSIGVSLHAFMEVNDAPMYVAELILWSGEEGKEIPVFINTQIVGYYKFRVAYDAIRVALKINNETIDDIFVFDDKGDTIEELSIEEIMAHFGDDSLKDDESED